MIIVKLRGGLGNQLFQYSLGRHLAIKNKTDLKFDTTWFGAIPDRKYELGNFKVVGSVATASDLAPYAQSVLGKMKQILTKETANIVTERLFEFDPSVLELGPDAYLDGYWQSEKYFEEIADIIRHDLQLKTAPSGQNKTRLDQIEHCDAVALHLRRGDYVTNQTANQHHGTTPLDYYYAGVKHLINTVKKPHFFVFSDDPEWVKEHLRLDYPTTYVTHNDPEHGCEDLRLMSACRHFIIANSSFSWWGAWLSSHPKKIIIAPKRWFLDSEHTDRDLIPNHWIRL